MPDRAEAPRCWRHIGEPPNSAAVSECAACLEAFERVVTRDLAKLLNAEIAPMLVDDVLFALAKLHAREP